MKKILTKENLILLFILSFSLFLRIFRINDLLGFYYDQGRDALVIWKLIHEGKFFLVGPVTGIEGIFLGPFYYYLIAPFYLIGGGSPVFVSICLSFISVMGIFFLYRLAKILFDKETGFLTIFIYGCSFSLVVFSRWLSNPNPLPTLSLLVVWSLVMIYRGKEKYWLLAALFMGLSLQLEAASAVFFLPAIFIFTIWQKSKIKQWRYILGGFLIFFITLLPQIIFNFKHDNVLIQSFERFLVTEKSFKSSFWGVLPLRFQFYYASFTSNLMYGQKFLNNLLMFSLLILLFFFRKDFFKNEIKILLLWILSPLILLIFYQGNNGYVWDYYLSGIWWVFILLVAYLLRRFARILIGKAFLVIFVLLFIFSNFQHFKNYYGVGTGVFLKNQLKAINWIYKDAGKEEFNVDVYVPPVIPYSYDYLFKWYGSKMYGKEPSVKNIKQLYTINEVDHPHPERLEKWLIRQNEIGKILYEVDFGDIKVQKRERTKFYE